ncbi:hypothetical protein AB0H73_19500 [Streptomyces olivoreticuli]
MADEYVEGAPARARVASLSASRGAAWGVVDARGQQVAGDADQGKQRTNGAGQ